MFKDYIWIICCFFSFFLKLYISTLGYNYDLESFLIAANIYLAGGSIYDETWRYNYGPIWFLILSVLKKIQLAFLNQSLHTFHFLICIFLATIDLLFSVFLRLTISRTASLFFILNPISIMLTGYHSQIENFALNTGLIAIWLLHINMNSRLKFVFSATLLGVSLSIKHIFFIFPIWGTFYFIKRSKYKEAFLILVIPIAMFFLCFIPFIEGEKTILSIKHNVFSYVGHNTPSLIKQLTEIFIPSQLIQDKVYRSFYKHLFIIMLTLVGLRLVRMWDFNLFHLALFYTAFLFILTPSMANQYLMIPLAFCSWHYKSWQAWIFTLVGSIKLLFSDSNLGKLWIKDPFLHNHIKFHYIQIWVFLLVSSILITYSKSTFLKEERND